MSANGPVSPREGASAALDGLRGWACLLVFNFHFLFTYTNKSMVGWGFAHRNRNVLQLPVVHLLISGHAMVAVFFVLSGYVLSYKSLKLLRTRSWEQAFRSLASSTFRRAFRLFIPAIVSILFITLAVRLGVYDYSEWVRQEGRTITGTDEEHPPIFLTCKEQIWDAYLAAVHLVDPWNWNLYYNAYNPHLWTIPVEFRCSLFLFIVLLSTSLLRIWCRLASVSFLTFYCIRWGRWDVALFLSGMMMAELDITYNGATLSHGHATLLPTQANSTEYSVEKIPPCHQPLSLRVMYILAFSLGLYIASCPNRFQEYTPGFRFLSTFTPKSYAEKHRFLQSIGAIILVFCISRCHTLQRPFLNHLAQYLGHISFSLYVVHGPILHSLGYSIMSCIWQWMGRKSDFQFCLGLLLGYVVCLLVSIWAAHMFWRVVDLPTVRFAKWLEYQLSVS
ncbi:uncharacterized protein GIQ15_06238 [Arthroderma uncinatum]|uniref:uncharacterized protein n=1 Tax=Arthroderma uncinatum TaxID=74035 RepID=UPI00144ABF76|nr:uncharacterized protein GIQ15_06238 [Arthroderma uncinatum]KAF3480891.1 hypothetical protein GIQ15_06238 [Arthroderma uncinatum]